MGFIRERLAPFIFMARAAAASAVFRLLLAALELWDLSFLLQARDFLFFFSRRLCVSWYGVFFLARYRCNYGAFLLVA